MFFSKIISIFALLKLIKMVNKYILDEIIKLPSNDSTPMLKTFHILSKCAHIDMVLDDNYDAMYRVKLEDILSSDLTNEELMLIHNGGWTYSKDNEYLVKILKK